MHGIELTRFRPPDDYAALLPGQRVSPPTGLTLHGSPQRVQKRDRRLVTAFHSPATVAPFSASIPGSTIPACYFTISTCKHVVPGPPSAPPPVISRRYQRVRPVAQVSCKRQNCASHLHSPPGFCSLGIEAFYRICRPSVRPCEIARSPFAPRNRFLLLVVATDQRSGFATFPPGLLLPKPLGTFPTMRLIVISVNRNVSFPLQFPQIFIALK